MSQGPYSITQVGDTSSISALCQGYVTVSLKGGASVSNSIRIFVNVSKDYIYTTPSFPVSTIPTDINYGWTLIGERDVGIAGESVSSFFLASDCYFCVVCYSYVSNFDIFISQEIRYMPWRIN